MPGVIILFAARVTFAFSCKRMDDDRPVIDPFGLFEGTHQHRHVVAIDVADVLEPKLVYECTGKDCRRNGVLDALSGPAEALANTRHGFERAAHLFLQPVVTLRFLDAIEIP